MGGFEFIRDKELRETLENSIEYLEYKFVEQLPKSYMHSEKRDLPVVIAVQEKIEKKERQIRLYELVNFFRSKKLIKEKTTIDILKLNDIRNTFHFNKPRTNKEIYERSGNTSGIY